VWVLSVTGDDIINTEQQIYAEILQNAPNRQNVARAAEHRTGKPAVAVTSLHRAV